MQLSSAKRSGLAILVLATAISGWSCKSRLLGESAIVVPETAELRSSTAKASRSAGILKRGDIVDIVEKSEIAGEAYARVKTAGGADGWMVIRNLVTRKNAEKSKAIASEVLDIPAQAECRNRSSVKLRLSPEKTADDNVIVQLPSGVTFEIIDRETRPKAPEKASPKATPKADADEQPGASYEVWYKVRVKDNPIIPAGFVYAGSVDLDVPHEISYFFQEGKRIVGWQRLGMVKDDRGQESYHYAVFQKSFNASDEKSDFDYLQVLGFDPKNKSVSYYNVMREAIRGVYPVKVKLDDRRTTFSFGALDQQNQPHPVEYVVEHTEKGQLKAHKVTGPETPRRK